MQSSPLSSPSDEQQLIASCQAGHLQDFDPLYQRYVRPIFSFIYRRTRDKQLSEDITSTVFLKALQNVHRYDSRKGSMVAWLYGIARNALTDHFRSNRHHANIDDMWDLSSGDDTTAAADGNMNTAQLREAMSKLDPAKREIVLLRVWDDLSYQDIAAITGKSEASCKMTFSRVIAQLRKDLPLSAFLLLCVAGGLAGHAAGRIPLCN